MFFKIYGLQSSACHQISRIIHNSLIDYLILKNNANNLSYLTIYWLGVMEGSQKLDWLFLLTCSIRPCQQQTDFAINFNAAKAEDSMNLWNRPWQHLQLSKDTWAWTFAELLSIGLLHVSFPSPSSLTTVWSVIY